MVATNVGQRPTHTGRLQSAETADDDVDHGLGMVAQVALRRWLGEAALLLSAIRVLEAVADDLCVM
jgi:hypothetical protein